jgi:hypothetical protein
VQHDVLTDSLTRQSEVRETCYNAGDGDQPCALASKTRRDPGDREDARRSAHNPATAERSPRRATSVPERAGAQGEWQSLMGSPKPT